MLIRLERKNGSDDEAKEKVKEKKTIHGEKRTNSEEKRRSNQKELSWMLGLGLVLYCLDSLPRW